MKKLILIQKRFGTKDIKNKELKLLDGTSDKIDYREDSNEKR